MSGIRLVLLYCGRIHPLSETPTLYVPEKPHEQGFFVPVESGYTCSIECYHRTLCILRVAVSQWFDPSTLISIHASPASRISAGFPITAVVDLCPITKHDFTASGTSTKPSRTESVCCSRTVGKQRLPPAYFAAQALLATMNPTSFNYWLVPGTYIAPSHQDAPFHTPADLGKVAGMGDSPGSPASAHGVFRLTENRVPPYMATSPRRYTTQPTILRR